MWLSSLLKDIRRVKLPVLAYLSPRELKIGTRHRLITPPPFGRLITTQATFHYLENRSEYKTTKPYLINLPERALALGLQSNEVSLPYHNIDVTGMRDTLDYFQLDRQGFEVIIEDENGSKSLLECATYEDYDNEHKIRQKVRPAVESFLKRKIPGTEDAIALSHQAC